MKKLYPCLLALTLLCSAVLAQAMHWEVYNDDTGELAHLVRGKDFATGTTARIGTELSIKKGGGHGRTYTLVIEPIGKDSCRIESETQEFENEDHQTTKETPDRGNLADFKQWKHLLKFSGKYQAQYRRLEKCIP